MAEEGKQVIRTRLGEREIALDSVIDFPRGLIGFEQHRRFVLLPLGGESPFLLLQSVTDPTLGLLVADPYPFVPDYEISLSSSEERLLSATEREKLAVLVTVTIPRNAPKKTTLNLSGPIVMNTETRLGLQIPQVDLAHPAKFPLVDGA
jgi:flagellar assembly factor FliW